MGQLTVADLIDTLKGFDPDATVRLAVQPNYPFEHAIGDLTEVTNDNGETVVYIADGGQVDYLSGQATEALGWN